MTVPKLYDHQIETIEFLKSHNEVFDTSDPGTGKTRAHIESFAYDHKRGHPAALVIAPKSLLKAAWVNDVRAFAPWLETSVATADNRAKAFNVKADMYITNTDAAKWLAAQPKSFWSKFEGGTVFMDECGAFKHHTSQRSKAMQKVVTHFEKKRGLNGTPNPNTVLDLWHQVRLIDGGKRLGTSFFGFRNQVCRPEQIGPRAEMVKWVDRPEAAEAVGMLLKDITIRHVFEECLSIPANHEYVKYFDMTAKHLKRYKEMEHLELLMVSPDTVVQAVNAAAVVTKLLQIASGAVYDNAGNYHVVDTDRYELIGDLLEQRKNSICFFNWSHQRDQLIAEAERRGLTWCLIDGTVSGKARDQAVDMFQAGFYRVAFLHPQSAAHGLTLTRATTSIWSSPTYNIEHFLQGSRRIYRAGQTQRTENISIIAPGTIEEHVYEICQGKRVALNEMLTLMKENE
jgi:SNF2 family DNA or RNA helicase